MERMNETEMLEEAYARTGKRRYFRRATRHDDLAIKRVKNSEEYPEIKDELLEAFNMVEIKEEDDGR